MIMLSLPDRPRVLAFARRAWIQQGATTVALAAVAGGLIGLLVFLGTAGVNTLTTTPGLIPGSPDGLAAVQDPSGEFLPLTSYLLTMAPAILGMLVAVVATLTLPGVVADDIRGGGIEALLAAPIPRRRLFLAYLGASLVLTGAAWSVAMLGFVGVGGITALVNGVTVSLSVAFVVAVFIIPLAMGVWSATVTLYGALLYPGSLDTKAGLNGGPIRLIAMLPAMITVPSILLLPDHVLPALAAVLAVTLPASAGIMCLAARGFRSTRVLGS